MAVALKSKGFKLDTETKRTNIAYEESVKDIKPQENQFHQIEIVKDSDENEPWNQEEAEEGTFPLELQEIEEKVSDDNKCR